MRGRVIGVTIPCGNLVNNTVVNDTIVNTITRQHTEAGIHCPYHHLDCQFETPMPPTPDSDLLDRLGLPLAATPGLPPELRDQLLRYLEQWGEPAELLALVEALRQVHGPLLFLLDHQAGALTRLGRHGEALEVIERRQRRSTSLLSQVREAAVLLALGDHRQARTLAADLCRVYPRSAQAISTASAVFDAVGDPERAETVVRTYLARQPHQVTAVLALTRHFTHAGALAAADAELQMLGAGIPAGIEDEDLKEWVALAGLLSRRETANAGRLELERRRVEQFTALQTALAPFVQHGHAFAEDPAQYYWDLHGPAAVPVTPTERRRIEAETLRHFNFDTLRSGQMETIAAVLRGESVLAVMPTGAGKSLCYQLPALIQPRATLVISPLVALMKDQVEGLPRAAQTAATFINSTLADSELAERMARISAGLYKLIYAAPERLRQQAFLRALRQAGVDLFVVDEAHCVSMWGHDFRPDYLFIQEARQALGNPPALAMTATAPPRVRDEIIDYITAEGDSIVDRPRPRVITMDVFRHNLHLSAIAFHSEDEKLGALLEFVAQTPGSGIVYVSTRHRAETLALALRSAGVAAEAYHAGLNERRGGVQDRFMGNQTRVVVATIAFGMGIDKPDIRFIVHFHPSRSLDAYYQEVGRAGRDGAPSQGVLFYSTNDWVNLRRWAVADEYSPDLLERVYQAVAAQLGASPGDEITAALAGPVDARRLQQVLAVDETAVRVAISILERAGLLDRGFDLPREVTVTLPAPLAPDSLAERSFARLLKGLALGPGQNATFATTDVAAFMRWPLHAAEDHLLDWQARGWLAVKGRQRSLHVEVLPHAGDLRERLGRVLTQMGALAQRRIDDMIGYATGERCRHGYISAHFGSPPRLRCTVCDNCTGIRPELAPATPPVYALPDAADIAPLIMDCLMSMARPVGRSALARMLAGSARATAAQEKARHFGALKGLGEAAILLAIDELLEDGRLRQYERQGYMVLAPTLRGRTEVEAWQAQHTELAVEIEPAADEQAGTIDAPAASRYTQLQRALWTWRRRQAEILGQPPYVIMSNELMLRVAERRPQTREELEAIPGIGAQRSAHYGDALLDLVKMHPEQPGDGALLASQRAAQTAPAPAPVAPPPVSPQLERRVYVRLQEIRQKLAIGNGSRQFEIANNSLLRAIAERAPGTLEELAAVPGFSESGLAHEATQIAAFVWALRQELEE